MPLVARLIARYQVRLPFPQYRVTPRAYTPSPPSTPSSTLPDHNYEVRSDLHSGTEAGDHPKRFPVEVGQCCSMERVFSAADVADCARLGGDTNPIHTDAAAARAAGFESQPVQGILCAGLFPAIIGTRYVRTLPRMQHTT